MLIRKLLLFVCLFLYIILMEVSAFATGVEQVLGEHSGSSEEMRVKKPRIVVLGAGYGSLMAMRSLEKSVDASNAELVLVNPDSYHYITTRLHELAAGTTPFSALQVELSRCIDMNKTRFIQDRVVRICPEDQYVHLESGDRITYDYLVVGLGSSPETFGIPGMKEHAYFIQDIHSVEKLLGHVEDMLFRYMKTRDKKFLSIVIGGAGLAGVEYLGELVDKIPSMCEAKNIIPEDVRIISVEAAPTILRGFDEEFVSYAKQQLEKKGVEFILGTSITRCDEEGIELNSGEKISAKTVVWTGGVRGNRVLEESGFETVRGRVKVDSSFRAVGNENVFVIGDCALLFDRENRPYPTTAQIAMQEGAFVGEYLSEFLQGKEGDLTPFSFTSKGMVASLGLSDGFGVIGEKRYRGASALKEKREIELQWTHLIEGVLLIKR